MKFLRETPLKRHLTQVLALILENTPLNAFLFLHGSDVSFSLFSYLLINY